MSITQWLIFILVIQIIHGLGTWKLYVKAGRQAWEAFIPVYNAVILMKIICRPWWWTILLFVPIVNLIMLPVVWVETARSFGKNQYLDTFLAVITLGFYNFYLNYATDVEYIKDRDINPKSSSGDWTSSILFAIVAATIVHTYFIQPFTIPSSSLEKSLLVGDFLFVSKFHYGARIPMTTVATPMVHDTIPGLNVKSYLFDDNFEERKTSWKNKLQLPYMRIPGFEDIERNDIVVFNQPADTLLDMNKFSPDRNYYKPIDKKTNLVKRCVGVPGDSLEVRNGYVYINGKLNELPDRAKLQFAYQVELKGTYSSEQIYGGFKRYDITDVYPTSQNSLIIEATVEAAAQAKNHPNVASITRSETPKGIDHKALFPRAAGYDWSYDNFGPIYIPKKGETIQLTMEVLPLYKRLIGEYERNNIVTRGNQIIINDQPATSYTFKQDYYWMMGDNRNNSIDARAWGYVPFDHVVGKPVFIWMSWDGLKNPRWERWFTTVGGSGNPVSYLIPFLVLLAAWFGFNAWRKKKKA
ncbi:signal peptidase I [Psychroserpens sp. AS72]|uniref:signal peptidase I n=1 Tax=Psychroserpens sp. AS72 TaxID=3135775 RepID=UPI00317A9FCA